MSRMLKALATAVAALALTISATPLGSELGSLDAGNSGGGKTGNWCC